MRTPRRPQLALAACFALAAAPAVAFAHGGDGRGKHGGGSADHPSQTTPTWPGTIALPNAFQPEGIASDGKALFVGSIPTGAIYRADPRTGQGAVLVQPRAGRAAIGLKVAGKHLVVAGGTTGRAFIYDARTGADVADVPLTTGNSFINDVAISKCGAFFTDSRQPQLYRVDLGKHGAKDDRGRRGKRLGGGGGHDGGGGHGGGHGGHHGRCDGPTVPPTTPPPTTPAPTTPPEPTATSTSKSRSRSLGPVATTIPITGALQYDGDPATNEANGIVALPKGKELLVVQSRTGQLFRVNASTGVSVEVPITGGPLTNGDGLLLFGRTLFVVQNRLNQIAVVKLARDLSGGEVKRTITSPLFRVPTTLAASRSGLYAVNARFGTAPSPTTDYDVVRVPLTK